MSHRLSLLLATIVFTSCMHPDPAQRQRPRLILQITVDALRGDLPGRYAHVLGEGGFRYLMKDGIVYENAHYLHANTETIVGHASLATGSVPAAHGMVGNVWFDRAEGRLVYNIEDTRYHLLTVGADVDRKTEIDPTQRAARSDGRSPNAMLATTFSDELAANFGGASKIFAVSVKDRGAVSLAGHAGKAFWFSKATGEFVTSSYYYDQYPRWVAEWNARGMPKSYAGKAWELLLEPSAYAFGDADDREYETDFPGYGRTFPHPFGDDKYTNTRLTLAPVGDELTLDFAKTLLTEEGLGQDDTPDYLAISFSSTDYVGHLFGASSLETEDNLARLDRTLADLLTYIDLQVGLENTLIVLSADHGQPEVPGYLNALGIAKPRHFETAIADNTDMIAVLKAEFGVGRELVLEFFPPYVYLDRELIREKGLDQAAVEAVVASEFAKLEGVADAVSTAALQTDRLPDNDLTRAVRRNFHPARSGDIHLVLEPYVFVADFDGMTVASTHGSPWRYDTFVPMIFAGAGLRPAHVSRAVSPYDIAPTLSMFVGVKPPSSTIGKPLPEVLGY